MYKQISHCIFDVDGTILDTERLYEQCFTDIIEMHGGCYTEALRRQVTGTPAKDGIKTILNTLRHLQITEVEFLAQLMERIAPKLTDVTLMPGVDRLVRHLHHHGVPMAVATSSDKKSFEIKSAKHAELFKLFHHIVTTPDDPEIKFGKPNPEVFLVTASRFPDNPSPDHVLVFEDSTAGAEAAICARMSVVIIPDRRILSLIKLNPTMILESLEDFDPSVFFLPSFDAATP